MQAVGCPRRHIVERKDNVVIVNLRAAEPPAPYFRGAGALRVAVVAGDEGDAYEHHDLQQRFIAGTLRGACAHANNPMLNSGTAMLMAP